MRKEQSGIGAIFDVVVFVAGLAILVYVVVSIQSIRVWLGMPFWP